MNTNTKRKDVVVVRASNTTYWHKRHRSARLSPCQYAVLLVLCCSTCVMGRRFSNMDMDTILPNHRNTLSVSSISAPIVVSPVGESKPNPVSQLAGYVKDSVTRSVDGCKLLWSNYGRCNDIRSKQKQHQQTLKTEWQNSGEYDTKQINQMAKKVNGGISYEEYSFLIKGKVDRSKLTQLAFMSWGASRFLPYYIMLFPEMLPSPFLSPPKAGCEGKWEAISRRRSHTVLQTLLNIERDAMQVSVMAKINFFGKKAQQEAMERAHHIGLTASNLFMAPPGPGLPPSSLSMDSSNGAAVAPGPSSILTALDSILYTKEEVTVRQTNLCDLPSAVVRGLGQAVEGGKPSPTDSILPKFFTRKKVLAHIQKVTECDEFFIKERIDIDSLGRLQLQEACNDRLMGGLGRTDHEMKQLLNQWLELVVNVPEKRLNMNDALSYNGNLARTSLMCYHALEGVRDARSASYLPRSLFQGKLF